MENRLFEVARYGANVEMTLITGDVVKGKIQERLGNEVVLRGSRAGTYVHIALQYVVSILECEDA